MIAQHSSDKRNHVTPSRYIAAARRALGYIGLDPASSERANEIVKASQFFQPPIDGLMMPWWADTCWLNPPGGRVAWREGRWVESKVGDSSAVVWWRKFMAEYIAGRFKAGIFLGFTLEILTTTQGLEVPGCASFPCCLSRRIDFLDPVTLKPQTSPTHANVFVYAGPDLPRFAEAFRDVGSIMLPHR